MQGRFPVGGAAKDADGFRFLIYLAGAWLSRFSLSYLETMNSFSLTALLNLGMKNLRGVVDGTLGFDLSEVSAGFWTSTRFFF